jgi:hypothetical protein
MRRRERRDGALGLGVCVLAVSDLLHVDEEADVERALAHHRVERGQGSAAAREAEPPAQPLTLRVTRVVARRVTPGVTAEVREWREPRRVPPKTTTPRQPGYEWDVFLSYPRDGDAGEWVRGIFAPQLEEALKRALPARPRIFRDEVSIEAGEVWPEKLRQGIRGSKTMVSVLSPLYFQSAWCRSEWSSMLARKKRVSFNPLYPVRFSDGEHYPPEAAEIQHEDFEPYAYTAPAFRQSADYLQFQKAMVAFGKGLAARILAAPVWRRDFPIVVERAALARIRRPRNS